MYNLFMKIVAVLSVSGMVISLFLVGVVPEEHHEFLGLIFIGSIVLFAFFIFLLIIEAEKERDEVRKKQKELKKKQKLLL